LLKFFHLLPLMSPFQGVHVPSPFLLTLSPFF
jgi:hypothetical protein